jgi:polysaccharide biosynthesis/export protein
MKRCLGFFRRVVEVVLVLQLCLAAFAQERTVRSFDAETRSSQASSTGAGAEETVKLAAKPGGTDGLGNPVLGERRPLYRLCRSDELDVSFTLSPGLNQSVTVQPDGYVWLRDAGLVSAQGVTLPEFNEAIRQAYRGYLHDPQVAVALKNFEHPYFIAGGEVARPGKFELRANTTALEAVEMAGGFTQQAKHSQVILFRRVNDELVESHVLNLKKMLKDAKLDEDPLLQPGDLLFVPQNAISKIARFLSRPALSMYVNSAQF